MEYYWVYRAFLRADPTPSSRWQTQNKLKGISGSPFLIIFCQGFFFLSFQIIFICVMTFCFCFDFYGEPVCVNMCVSSSICVSSTFSVAHFLLFILSYFSLFCFAFYFIFIILQIPICFLMRDRRGLDLYGRGGREKLRGYGRREIIITCIFKIHFQ